MTDRDEMPRYEVRGCAFEDPSDPPVGIGSWPLSVQEDIDNATFFGLYENEFTEDGEYNGSLAIVDDSSLERLRKLADWLNSVPEGVRVRHDGLIFKPSPPDPSSPASVTRFLSQ